MHRSAINVAVLSLLSAVANGKTVRVDVGKGGLVFSPDSVTADKGDTVEFFFGTSIPHSVAEGDFSTGCAPLDNGFYSGMMSGSSNAAPAFAITVDSTDPIFFYCAVDGHCQEGMVGAINPSSDQTLAKWKDAATKASKVVVPKATGGGQVIKPGQSLTMSSMMSSAMSSGMASSTAPTSTSGSAPSKTMSTGMTTGSSGMSPTSTAAGSGTVTTSGTSAPTSTGAADHLGNSFGGIVAAAAGVAAMLM